MIWIHKMELCFMSQTGFNIMHKRFCSNALEHLEKTEKDSPEGMILYLKTRCFSLSFMGAPVLTSPLIKPSNVMGSMTTLISWVQ